MREWLHATLPLCYFILLLAGSFVSFSPAAENVLELVFSEIFFLHLLIYGLFSLKQVKGYQRELSLSAHRNTMVNLQWLRILLAFTTALYATSFTTLQVALFFPGIDLSPFNLVIQLILVLLMYTISYKSIIQPELFTSDYVNHERSPAKEKYQTSSLHPEKARTIQKKLLQHMKEKKPFLDANLSLEILAKQISESKHHVSQVINDKLKQSFNDFINSYRIEEFKRLVLEPSRRKLTVQELSQRAGFNSKSAFNTTFKKFTGKPPREFYRENIKTQSMADL
jgi:AraC-like DNA-binding protein